MVNITDNKRGNAGDIFIWIAIGVIALIFIGGWMFFTNTVTGHIGAIDDDIGGGQSLGNISNQTLGQYNSALQSDGQWIPVAFFFGMMIFIFASALMVRVHGFFFVVYILITVMAVIVSVPISNWYTDTLLQDATLGPTFQTMSASNFIMQYLPLWVSVIGIIGGVFVVMSWRSSRDQVEVFG